MYFRRFNRMKEQQFEEVFQYKAQINTFNEGVRSYVPVESNSEAGYFITDLYILSNLIQFQYTKTNANQPEFKQYLEQIGSDRILNIYLQKQQSEIQRFQQFNKKLEQYDEGGMIDYSSNYNFQNQSTELKSEDIIGELRSNMSYNSHKQEDISSQITYDNYRQSIQNIECKQYSSLVNQELNNKPLYNYDKFLKQINVYAQQIHNEFMKFLIDLNSSYKQQNIKSYLKKKYQYFMDEKIKEMCCQQFIKQDNFSLMNDKNIMQDHAKCADIYRKQKYLFNHNIKITDQRYKNSDYLPIIFVDIFLKIQDYQQFLYNNSQTMIDFSKFKQEYQSQYIKEQKKHIYFMAHGFQGLSYDLRLIKNILEQHFPHLNIVILSSNEMDTTISIEDQGKNIAYEVREYLEKEYGNNQNIKISFWGFSMGGLTLRSAFQHLIDYTHLFYNYVSLSSPHLGCTYKPNMLVDTGMWIMEKWNNNLTSLKQLSMRDHSQIEDTYLYKLSQSGSLSPFKNVVLFSSCQDQYVPFHSARIEYDSQSKTGCKFAVMAENILNQKHSDQRVVRIDVNYKMKNKQKQSSILPIYMTLIIYNRTFDTFIGRAAHIEFIDNCLYLNSVLYNFGYLFK